MLVIRDLWKGLKTFENIIQFRKWSKILDRDVYWVMRFKEHVEGDKAPQQSTIG
jgi:hypothetical protein